MQRTAAGLRRGVERLLVQETDRRRGPVGRPRYWHLSPPFHRCDTLSRANLCLPVRPALGSLDPEGGNGITGILRESAGGRPECATETGPAWLSR